MPATDLHGKVVELAVATTNNCESFGEARIIDFEAASRPLLLWLNFLEQSESTSVADCLLTGCRSAIHEAAACLCLGLARPALNSMRLQLDLILGWLYFKDHPKEWEKVEDTGNGFKLKKELNKYFEEHFPRYSDRLGVLLSCAIRSNKDPYRFLSAHMHGQSETVLPQVDSPVDIVANEQSQHEVVSIQSQCVEYVCDILWSIYADKWAALGPELTDGITVRFKTVTQRAAFFSG